MRIHGKSHWPSSKDDRGVQGGRWWGQCYQCFEWILWRSLKGGQIWTSLKTIEIYWRCFAVERHEQRCIGFKELTGICLIFWQFLQANISQNAISSHNCAGAHWRHFGNLDARRDTHGISCRAWPSLEGILFRMTLDQRPRCGRLNLDGL